MTKKCRMTAYVTCFALLFVMFISTAYIIKEADHDCTGENCPICHEIQICQKILNTVGTAIVAATFFVSALVVLNTLPTIHFCETAAITLISLKVKLSD